MGKYTSVGMKFSYLERMIKIYYNKGLEDLNIGWGQQYCLECIFEKPGITPLDLKDYAHVDKATISKVLKKLVEIGYIEVKQSETDKRVRHIYLNDCALPAIDRIKILHQELYDDLTLNLSDETVNQLEITMDYMLHNLTDKKRYKLEQSFLERKDTN